MGRRVDAFSYIKALQSIQNANAVSHLRINGENKIDDRNGRLEINGAVNSKNINSK